MRFHEIRNFLRPQLRLFSEPRTVTVVRPSCGRSKFIDGLDGIGPGSDYPWVKENDRPLYGEKEIAAGAVGRKYLQVSRAGRIQDVVRIKQYIGTIIIRS